MSTRDPIKEIIDEFEYKISFYKKEREEAIHHFKNVLHIKKIEDIKENLKSNEKLQHQK